MDELDGFNIEIKSHSRARRMKLRYDVANERAVVTIPPFSSRKEAKRFALKHVNWLKAQRRAAPERILLMPGFSIPIAGQEKMIVHDVTKPTGITVLGNEIIVGGTLPGFPKRLENYLKKQAREKIASVARCMAQQTGKSFQRIQIRDTKSRWGSCSTSGTLSFSWRLIMTPPEILNYVVAHEVAHLSEMNHSAAFWKVVDSLVGNAKASRRWLKSDGQLLMFILSETE